MPLASIYVIEASDILSYLMDIWNNKIPLPLVSLLNQGFVIHGYLCLDCSLMDYSHNNVPQIVKYFFLRKSVGELVTITISYHFKVIKKNLSIFSF